MSYCKFVVILCITTRTQVLCTKWYGMVVSRLYTQFLFITNSPKPRQWNAIEQFGTESPNKNSYCLGPIQNIYFLNFFLNFHSMTYQIIKLPIYQFTNYSKLH